MKNVNENIIKFVNIATIVVILCLLPLTSFAGEREVLSFAKKAFDDCLGSD